jgi:hypothetical protein
MKLFLSFFCLYFHSCFLFAENMIPKGKQKDPSSNASQPLSPRIQTIHQQGVKTTTRKRRQGENSTPTRRSHRNKGLQPDVVLETVEEDCASSMHSNDQPQVHSNEKTMTMSHRLEPLFGQDQNIIEHVATKIVDNIVDLVAEQVIEESTLEKSHQENQDNLQHDDTQDSQEIEHFQVTQTSPDNQQFQETQTSPANQHFQDTPDSQHTEQFQEQTFSLLNQRSEQREHSLTLSQGTISTSQFTGGPSEGVTNRRKKEKVNFNFMCVERFEF